MSPTGSSILLKDSPAGCATRSLVSHYVLLTQKTVCCVAYYDSCSNRVQLFVNSTVEVVESDFDRLKSVVDLSDSASRDNANYQSQCRPNRSLFQSEFERRPPASSVASSSSSLSHSIRGSPSPATASTSAPRRPTLDQFRAPENLGEDSIVSGLSGPSANSSKSSVRVTSAASSSRVSSSPSSSKLATAANATEDMNFDFGCDIDEQTLSQMFDDDF